MKKIKKDSSAVLDYVWDWGTTGTWLGADTIASATVVGAGCTVDSYTNTTTTVTGWISGGTTVNPSATCHITTAGGRQEDRTIIFEMTDR
jgi:hypothetical protein